MVLEVLELTKINTMIWKFIKGLFGKYDEISFRQGFDLTKLAIATFYQGEEKLNLLLDTGSNTNIINKKVLERLKYELSGDKVELQGIEGQQKSENECIIELIHKDVLYRCPFTISDLSKPFSNIKKESGVTLHGIIGTEFFNKYKYVLDFEKLVAYSKI